MRDRRLEDRIRELCAQMVATNDDQEVERLSAELGTALNDFIGGLKAKTKAYREKLHEERKSKE